MLRKKFGIEEEKNIYTSLLLCSFLSPSASATSQNHVCVCKKADVDLVLPDSVNNF